MGQEDAMGDAKVMKCEVCDAVLADAFANVVVGVLLESDGHCSNGCYFCQYAYGNSEDMIDGVTWQWSYTDTADEFKTRNEERNQVIGYAMAKRMSVVECLWNAFNDDPDELFRLGIIADAYEDIGDEDVANCLRWAWREERKPNKDEEMSYHWFAGTKWYGDKCDQLSVLPDEYCMFVESAETDYAWWQEYCFGHDSPALAYQFLIRMWKAVGGIKEKVTA